MSDEQNIWLSKKPIPVHERLIFALDVPSAEEALRLVQMLGDGVSFYKIGLELFMANGYFTLVDELARLGKKTFVDLKLFDVPNTVGSAVRQLRNRPVEFLTVHGDDEIMKAACRERSGIKILAVTVLTSINDSALKEMGYAADVESLVLSRAKRAVEIGCDGVIASGLEATALRNSLGEEFLIITPGIRSEKTMDDQKRTVDVEQAFRNGADHIVMGRPIRQAGDPADAARKIQRRIARVFEGA